VLVATHDADLIGSMGRRTMILEAGRLDTLAVPPQVS